MSKRIVIKIGAGSLESGYDATVQIGEENAAPQIETSAHLPPAPDLLTLYRAWQQAYWQLGLPYRLEAQSGVTNVSDTQRVEHCRTLSRQLRDCTHEWLNSYAFQPIREKLLEQLNPQDKIRVLLQTQDPILQRLPWYELQFFQRYRSAEVGICSLNYQKVNYPGSRSKKVRILAVLGNAAKLDTSIDCELLSALPDAEISFLKEPDRETFNNSLWDKRGWDILFFAGHSSSLDCTETPAAEGSGEILLNPTERLTIPQLRHALKKAIERGLNTAIFNSCDGLGLAADLADLYIPQVLVMREPVPDKVAHSFLQGFLESFSSGATFYAAVREAREKMQGLEARFPCATWLPVIVQNLAEMPPTWLSLQGKEAVPIAPKISPFLWAPNSQTVVHQPLTQSSTTQRHEPWKVGIGAGTAVSAILFFLRFLGLLMPFELAAYDALLRLRATETMDDQLLIVMNTAEDTARWPDPAKQASMSDQTLLNVINKLNELSPQLIGLDIYRDNAATLPELQQQIETTDNLIFICKAADPTTATTAIAPPPELTSSARVGTSDFVYDGAKEVVRRQLLDLSAPPPCNPDFTFSTLLAQRYLSDRHNIEIKRSFIGTVPIPFISKSSFGGYAHIDRSGKQILLNYRIMKDPAKANCQNVVETPARCVTVSQIIDTEADELRSLVEGRIVLIGTVDPQFIGSEPSGDSDLWITPYTAATTSQQATPGLFLQAQMVSQLINAAVNNRLLLTSWPEWKEMLWILSWVVLGGCIGLTARLQILYLRLLLAEGILLLACWFWLTGAGVWLPWVPTAVGMPVAAATAKWQSDRQALAVPTAK